ncbi:LPXTG cell wall anchor domain-containing protein [Georgenia deserti]|uniref:LPXTG cell wall anchor domain-containing protein n=1 Tax=Georgenia deserti TaxID=2093781 RepID=A0ABW4L3J4_9MICO
MKRRALATTAATAGLVLVPTAALADYASSGSLQLSTTNPVVGEPFTATVETDEFDEVTLDIQGPDEVADEAIEIAGQASASSAVEDGSATFDVTINEAGSYTLTAQGPDGEEIDSVTVEVVPAGDSEDDGDDAGDEEDGGGLPDTGAGNSTPLIIGSATLLAAGAAVLVFARSQQKRV